VTQADWRTITDAAEFLAEAGGYLRADPVENTVLLTIADRLQSTPAGSTTPAGSAPLFGWCPGTPTSGGRTPTSGGGAFVHTRGWPILLSPMTGAAAAGLAGLLRDQGRDLAGVNAAPATAEAFAAQWRRAAGPEAASRVYQRQRLFRLGELTPPPPPPGQARVAAAADRDLLVAWEEAFHAEAENAEAENAGTRARHSAGHAPMVDSRLAYGGQLVWETGGQLVATAARTRVVGQMSRIAPVYTPPAERGKGYGGAVTVAASRAAQQAGATDVVLFTDLANPTSNALYQRLGYRPVSDRLLLSFTAA
jgi:RimJ/RimL family protein N-acetyltransferase